MRKRGEEEVFISPALDTFSIATVFREDIIAVLASANASVAPGESPLQAYEGQSHLEIYYFVEDKKYLMFLFDQTIETIIQQICTVHGLKEKECIATVDGKRMATSLKKESAKLLKGILSIKQKSK